MNDPRYNSGSSLTPTAKEEDIDRIEAELGEMSDSLFIALKKLSREQLAELLRLIREKGK